MLFRTRMLVGSTALLVAAIGIFVYLRVPRDEQGIQQTNQLTVTTNTQQGNVEAESIDTESTIPEPHPVSLPALMQKTFNGSELKLVRVLDENSAYTRHHITYRSGTLTISGIMNIPKGKGPFPVLILNHGHIDTSVYTNGRGLKREQDYLARQGFVVLHSDYRNHAQSSTDDRDALAVRLGYVEDVINAVYAVRAAKLPALDAERIGMLGHSMGGGITLSVLVLQPDIVDAAVLYAPVSGDMRDSYERWIARESNNAKVLGETYGTPEANPTFWDNLAAATFYDRVKAPVKIFHGTGDSDVPIAWSQRTVSLLKAAGKDVELVTYPGAPHEFSGTWADFMRQTAAFYKANL